MMSTGGGGGRRKALDTEINLIPMIDLLICCIAFLLITAVWTQLARLAVTQANPGQADPLDEPPKKTKIVLMIHDGGYKLTDRQSLVVDVEKKAGAYDTERLKKELQAIRLADPERHDLVVSPADGVLYKFVVEAMDLAIHEKFPDLQLSNTHEAFGG